MAEEHLELYLESQLGLHIVLPHYLFGDLLESVEGPIRLQPGSVYVPVHSLTTAFPQFKIAYCNSSSICGGLAVYFFAAFNILLVSLMI